MLKLAQSSIQSALAISAGRKRYATETDFTSLVRREPRPLSKLDQSSENWLQTYSGMRYLHHYPEYQRMRRLPEQMGLRGDFQADPTIRHFAESLLRTTHCFYELLPTSIAFAKGLFE